MKLILTISLVFVAFCSVSQSKYTWEEIKGAPEITVKNAASVNSYDNTIESVVTYFFASRIRNDKEWEKVLPVPENRSEQLKRKLITYSDWTFTKFRLISKTEYEPGHFWVKVDFEVQYDGKVDGGIDEVDVEWVDGKWLITSIPT